MRFKKTMMLLICMCVFTFGTTGVYAEQSPAWHVAEVKAAAAGAWYQVELRNLKLRPTGANPNPPIIRGNTVALLLSGKQKELLAVLLTAQSLGAAIEVYVDGQYYDPNAGQFPTVFTAQIVTD